MPAFEILEQPTHHRPHAPRILDQIVFFIHSDRRQCRRASERMTVVSQTTVKDILFKVVRDPASHAHSAKLHVRARQSLRHRDQIRNDFPVIDREPFSSATKTRHHFIGDQHDAVLVAKIAQALACIRPAE